jgi:lichenan operon transcriptional antiterminator
MRMPGNYEERKKYILEKILLSQQCPTIDSLSDRLCISPLTLQNELSRLRTELSELGLHLKIKNNKLSIIGLDRDKRRLILDLINNELENSSFSLEEIQEFFSNVDLKNIKKIVLNVLKENEYFLDDYSLLNYILHIAIFIELTRMQIQK